MKHRHRHREREHEKQEMLETIWTLREGGNGELEEIFKLSEVENPENVLDELIAEKLVTRKGNKVVLTPAGEQAARTVIRRHRLAEVLFNQILDMDDERTETEACEFEHLLNPEVTESICTLLGHPASCPHGKPIPPARCCEKFRTEVQPLVQRLSDIAVGQTGRITVIAPKFRSRLDRLGALGIIPGAEIKLCQKFPSFVVQLGQTTIAIDKDIANEIFVRLAPLSSP